MAAQDEDQDYEDYEEDKEKGLEIVPETGMPYVDAEEAEASVTKTAIAIPLMILVPRVICGGIAFLIYYAKKDMYDLRIAAGQNDGMGYLYLAGVAFAICVELANVFPAIYKGTVLPGNAGNLRANMIIFKVQQPKIPYVVMEQEGNIGKYNRANRAMYHLVENGMQVLVSLLLAGRFFGEAVFVLVLIYAVARLWYQIAYTTGGYGFGCCKHAFPFILHTALVAHILEMLVFVAGVRLIQQ